MPSSRLITMIAALLALGLTAGAADAQNDVCSGIAGCTVAPTTPLSVVVNGQPTTYDVQCPSGLVPARVAVSTQPGLLTASLPIPSLTDSYVPGVGVTVPAAPTVVTSSPSGGALVPGTSGAAPTFYNAFGPAYAGEPMLNAMSDNVAVQGTTSTTGEQGTGSFEISTTVAFTAGVPASAPTSASGNVPDPAWSPYASSTWQVAFTGGWSWWSPASMTPSVGCVPAPAARKRATQQRTTGDRRVPHGTARHWLRCPSGTERVGDLEHAVYVPNRSRLTVAERRAIDSRLVQTAGGGQHIETRLGARAPVGVRVQLHAACRG